MAWKKAGGSCRCASPLHDELRHLSVTCLWDVILVNLYLPVVAHKSLLLTG